MTMEPTASSRSVKFLRRTILLATEHGKITRRAIKAASDYSHEQKTNLPLFMKAISLSLLILASGITLQAKLVTKTVSYEQNGAKLEGYLAYDDSITAKGKVPGIVVFPEWWGLNDYIKGRADQLANLGYVAFAADMYGGG